MKTCKKFRFEAAHRLENWPKGHQCYRLHGHSYKVELIFDGTPLLVKTNKPGVLIDFGEVSSTWRASWSHASYIREA
ncbi:MAG: 6-carboxytetrahydropterin synthase [candidate division NC10 bacterium]|jgi:6-pyruvoyltetrahydropterin/6-carboxytetrahydropterin synthase